MLLALLVACSPAPSTTEPAPTPPVVAPAPAPSAELAALRARDLPQAGWGALLWLDETWYSTGGGTLAAGPKGTVTLAPTGSTGACGAIVADPAGAMITLPVGASAPTLTPAPAIQAALVERAAWRLDELLPTADRYTPLPTSPDPSRARGVVVGSVAKVRRHGAPPVLVAAGHRDCTGVIAVLDAEAGRVLAWDQLTGSCEPLRVLPPNDLDGDGHRELAAWSRGRAALYRLAEDASGVELERLADWTCK